MSTVLNRPEIADTLALRRRGLTLALLTLTYFFRFIDRQILAILLEPIKADLKLHRYAARPALGARLRDFLRDLGRAHGAAHQTAPAAATSSPPASRSGAR
ncbi:hypothetical protein AB5I41_02365 [Sphingomonas sp. MMS24-JH45]